MAKAQRSIRAGLAYVEATLDSDKLLRGLANVERRLNGWGRRIANIGGGLAAIGGGITGSLLATLPAAARVEGSISRLRALYKGAAGEAEQFAQSFSARIGQAPIAIRESLNTFKALSSGFDLTNEQTTQFARTMTTVAADFAAFNSLSLTDGIDKLKSALTGSGEAVDQFGLIVNAAALNLEFQRMGIDKTVQSASELEKMFAKLAITQRTLANQGATGAAERLSGSITSTLAFARDAVSGLSGAIGIALAPALEPYRNALATTLPLMKKWIADNAVLIQRVFRAGVVISAVGGSLLGLGAALKAGAVAFGLMGSAVAFLQLALAPVAAIFGLISIKLILFTSLFAAAIAAAREYGVTLSSIVSTARSVGSAIGRFLLSVFASLPDSVQSATSAFGAFVQRVVGGMGSIVSAVVGRLGRALGSLVGFFNDTRATLSEAWGAVVAAVRSGNLEAAFEVIRAAVSLVWLRMVTGLRRRFADFKRSANTLAIDVKAEFVRTFIDLWAGVASASERGVSVVVGILDRLWNATRRGYRNLTTLIGEGILRAAGAVDPEFDAEGAIAILREEAERKNRANAAAVEARMKTRRAERDRKVKRIQEERDAALAEVERQRGLSHQRNVTDDAAVKEAEARLAAAEKRFQAATDAAKTTPVKAPGAPGDGGGGGGFGGFGLGGSLNEKLKSLAGGGFNAAALSLQFPGGDMIRQQIGIQKEQLDQEKQQTDEMKKQNKILDKVATALSGGAAFVA